MLFWDSGKAPGEVADYDVDWTARLGADTIVASTWAIVGGDAPASGTLAINSNIFTTTLTKVFLSAGNLGVTYTLVNTVTTGAGDTLTEQIQLPVRNPPTASSLTTLANAMQYLGVAQDDDGKVGRIVNAISTQIQAWLGYQVAQQSYSRTFNGQGTRKFFVPDLPLVSVQSLTINGQTIQQGSWSSSSQLPGYYNDSQSIFLVGYHFPHGFQNISMTYTAGYAQVPPDIEQASLDWSKIVYTTGTLPFGANVVRVQAGDSSFDFGGQGAVTSTKFIPMPASIYAVLQNYRRVAQISGYHA
jgi:hypothetical protein